MQLFPCTAMISRRIDGVNFDAIRECGALHTGTADHSRNARVLYADSEILCCWRTDKLAEFLMFLDKQGKPFADFNPYTVSHAIFG